VDDGWPSGLFPCRASDTSMSWSRAASRHRSPVTFLLGQCSIGMGNALPLWCCSIGAFRQSRSARARTSRPAWLTGRKILEELTWSPTPGLHPTLFPISGSRRNKPDRSLTAAQERCLHAFGGLDSNTVIHLSDIIALQCYTITGWRFC